MTTDKAQQIWKVFCNELTQKPTDDMREALSTSLREVINLSNEWVEIGGDSWDMSNVVFVDAMLDIADEIEALK
jgi:hypothetical protein